jgi:hypothetical protein
MEQLNTGLWNGHPASPAPRRAAWSAVQTLRQVAVIRTGIQYASASLDSVLCAVPLSHVASGIQYANARAGSRARTTASPAIRAWRLDLPTGPPRSIDFSRLPAAAAGCTAPLRRLALAPLRAGRRATLATGLLRSRQGRRRVASRYREAIEAARM